jgi:ribosomal protein L11 methylase PrmA
MLVRDPASFRDPAGHVYIAGDRILRSVSASAAPAYESIRNRGLLSRGQARGWVVGTRETTDVEAPEDDGGRYWLEHDRIPFISYPYEWPFGALKAAALLHLDLQIDAFEQGVTLSDGSAYNVQFRGATPVFIDVLSFRPYTEGEYWAGHRQFCRQFLNPLLLRALAGLPHNAWYRGSLDGIGADELDAVLSFRRKLSFNVFTQVTFAARLEARAVRTSARQARRRPPRPLPRSAYAGLLHQLRGWIARLTPRGHDVTTWSGYEEGHSYADAEHGAKRTFVERFLTRARPSTIWDFGCNTGEYAELACRTLPEAVVIGFEADHGALERAFARAAQERLNFLPLYMDAANPSPSQGWNEAERGGLASRGPAQAMLALALVHHLAIGRNTPLPDLVRWLASFARAGVIEFIPKSDPMVQLMLAQRDDVFPDYHEAAFTAALSSVARIVERQTISAAGRQLFLYERA